MSDLFVDNIKHQSSQGSGTITIGASGETINVVGTLNNNGSALISGITSAQQWRLPSNLTTSSNNTFVQLTNFEQANSDGAGSIGSFMSNDNGIFTFPSTGIWLIAINIGWQSGTPDYASVQIHTTTDNSTYNEAQSSYIGISSSNHQTSNSGSFIFDVENTSTHKVKFGYYVASQVTLKGSGSRTQSGFDFIRLGDT